MQTTSKLTAVNSMLASVGEAPINTLEDVGVVDAITAISALEEVTREVLVEGYTFNTDKGYPIIPEGFDPWEAKIPPNALSVVPSDRTLVVRGERIYDTQTFSFSHEGRNEITCDIIWGLDFDELPEVTRQYVAIRAARRFQKRAVASELLNAITADDERQALWAHRRANTRIKKKNFLFDSNSVRNIHNTR
ncbi:hypothetical protein [Shimia sp.]|uniref:hypothetical protein n=1 Tax=Shimia sp. TaxID=1954381 RepID=UPI003BA9DCFD